MEDSKTSTLSHGLIWFGAAVSIAEILTGALFAPLGFSNGLLAIMLGHVIGCMLFYLSGLIGARTGKSAMETVKISFGQKGSLLFSLLNILQLVGWTAVMIASAATAASSLLSLGGDWIWCLLIGLLILLWLVVGKKSLDKINIAAMAALFAVTVVLCIVVFRGQATTVTGAMSFGAAVELSVAMPLSWLPLVSDYTRNAKKPATATLVSTVVYFLTSCWMYVIGLGAALFTGQSDIAAIMLKAGLGIVGLIVVIFSTVTTTFLDVYSAGVSSESISKRLKERPIAVAVLIVGTLLAIFVSMTQYENFLYLIGSVFAPMIAVLIADFFILKQDHTGSSVSYANLIIWAVGFILYRLLMGIETPIGITLPVMVITALISIVYHQLTKSRRSKKHV